MTGAITPYMTYSEIKNQIEADEISIDQILVNIDEAMEKDTITTPEARELEGMLEA
jgi:hypothetical protein